MKKEEYRRVLSPEESGIPCLPVFGCAEGRAAPLPVLEHRHSGKTECILVLEGMQRHLVNGEEETVYAGEGLIIRPEETHACFEKQDAAFKVIWFQVDMTGGPDFLGLSGEDARLLYEAFSAFSGRHIRVPETVLHKFGEAFSDLCEKALLKKLSGRLLFLQSLLKLLQSPAQTRSLTSDIDRAKQYIHLHVQERIDVDELLLESGLSIAEFRKKFEEQVGCPPRDYILHVKIQEAKEKIASTNQSIADIAYQYHFSSVGFFRVRFKQELGISASKYRRRMKKSGSGRGRGKET